MEWKSFSSLGGQFHARRAATENALLRLSRLALERLSRDCLVHCFFLFF